MENWKSVRNWTKSDYKSVVKEYLEDKECEFVCFEVSGSDSKNISDIIKWAKEDGYVATEKFGGEVLKIEKWKEK